MSKFLKVLVASSLVAAPVYADGLGLGREALPEEIAAWDIDVRPDGTGLPVGQGSVEDGEVLFSDQCAVCHGDFGEAVGRWPQLAGGFETLTRDRPVKTIGSFWPYASTVYDYVHRAMPFGNAQSLSPDDTYAITAYLLYLNDVVDDEFVLSNENFSEIALINEPNFYLDDRAETELGQFTREPCMENCKDEVKITMRAAVLDVTPEADGGIDMEGGGTSAQPAVASAEPAAEPAAQPAAEPAAVPAIDTALAEAGERVFKKCSACHQVGDGAKNRTGPELNDLFGRTAGTLEGFRYSNAMKAAGEEGLVWTAETMAEFMQKPRDFIKGTKMSFAGLKSDDEIAAVTEYLKTYSQ